MLTAHGASHLGHVRKINEDSWLADLDLGLFIVADGMGGHKAGEVASQMTVEAIRGFIRRTQEENDVTWPYGIDPKLSFNANRLRTAIKLGNRRVFRAGESGDNYTGMGSTVVAALVIAGQLIFAGVGDSRIYSVVGGRILQLTKDDSWLTAILEDQKGQIVPAKHPMRHVLTSVVGAQDQIELQVMEHLLVDREMLLLCSDGLHGELDDTAIANIMSSGSDVEVVANELVRVALERQASDNITVVVVSYRV